jgi:hypothetical protein
MKIRPRLSSIAEGHLIKPAPRGPARGNIMRRTQLEVCLSSDHPASAISTDGSLPSVFDRILDVMLQAISSPRAEGASPPSPRCRYLKNAVTEGLLQLNLVPCSSVRCLWTVPLDGASGRCLWTVPLDGASGRCLWTVLLHSCS